MLLLVFVLRDKHFILFKISERQLLRVRKKHVWESERNIRGSEKCKLVANFTCAGVAKFMWAEVTNFTCAGVAYFMCVRGSDKFHVCARE